MPRLIESYERCYPSVSTLTWQGHAEVAKAHGGMQISNPVQVKARAKDYNLVESYMEAVVPTLHTAIRRELLSLTEIEHFELLFNAT